MGTALNFGLFITLKIHYDRTKKSDKFDKIKETIVSYRTCLSTLDKKLSKLFEWIRYLGTVYWILLGCQAPTQATFLRPLWVFLGSFLQCQRLVTPKKQEIK